MHHTVSVKKAIRKGKIMLAYIPVLLIIGGPVLGIFLINFTQIVPWFMLVCLVGGFVSGFLFWSYNVVKWKVWAYENVRNVHELKSKAIRYNLIHPDGSWFNKLEIKNDSQREKLNQLEKKFLIEDVYEDDPSVPSEIKVSYSKWKALLNSAVFGVVVWIGATLLSKDITVIGGVVLVGGIYLLLTILWRLIFKQDLFRIGNNGVTTKEFGSLSWDMIPYCYVEQRGFGKQTEEYFVFFAKGKGSHEVLLDETNISMEKLEDCIRVYRIRHGNTTVL